MPILFPWFVEDLELFLQNDVTSGLSFDDILFILLLFADGMVILDKSIDEIDTSLELLCNYCNTWSLEVNAQTTKVMFFSKKRWFTQQWSFTYNGNRLEVVNDFNYLATVLNYTGKFSLNQQQLVGKGLKTLNVLLKKCRKYIGKPKIRCKLFYSFIGSILDYACEMSGFSKSKKNERIHLKFCKNILMCKMNTPNYCSLWWVGTLSFIYFTLFKNT